MHDWQDKYDGTQQDDFIGDDTYEEYTGPDLSGDPMAGDQRKPKKGWRARRREKRALQEQERLERERAVMRAEIMEEMRAKGMYFDEEGSPDASETNDAGAGESRAGEQPRRRSKFSENLMGFLSGNILSRQEVRRTYPYLLFLALLAFLYIANVFHTQNMYRRREKLTVEVRELRAKSLTIASEKMKATRQSNIIGEIERRRLPLRESLEPNKVIRE